MEIEDGIDVEKGKYEHTEAEIVDAFHRAGKIISCAHAVFPVRSRSKNKWFPVIVFWDQDNKSFHHAFALESKEEILSIAGKLMGCLEDVERRNGANP